MKKVVLFELISVLPIFCCCCGQSINESKVFNYPVTMTSMPEITGELSPELFSEFDYPTSQYKMMGDSVMFARNFSSGSEYFFSFVDLASSDTLARICRKGRGPDEMLTPVPFFDVTDNGKAHIVDYGTSTYYQLNLTESLKQKTMVVDQKLDLTPDGVFSPFYSSVIQNKLLCFNSVVNKKNANLDGVPHFLVFDLSDGHCIDTYRCFGDIPSEQKADMKVPVQTTLYFYFTTNQQTGQLFFANLRNPQINFLDCNTGSLRGIRFGSKMRLSLKNPYKCFYSVDSDSERIYALFYGEEVLSEEKTSCSKLFVFDWDGNVRGLFQLDGRYSGCEVVGDKLFLSSVTMEDKLFCLSLEEIASTL